MSHIDSTIARIPTMTARERSTWRHKADAVLQKKPGNADALRLLGALDSFESGQSGSASLEVTGLLAWEKYERGTETPFRAFHGERVVGRIIKSATHTANRKQVYSVEILGQALSGRWENISGARKAGEAAYVQMQADTPT